jgi:hypothetical protein
LRASYARGSATGRAHTCWWLISQESGRAVVGIERYDADPTSYRLPGFWPSRWIVTTAEVRLAEEAGRWKAALP